MISREIRQLSWFLRFCDKNCTCIQYNVSLHKQGNKLNHTFVSHNFMLSNITRNAFSQWRESYSNSFARFENLNRAVKMFLCKINFQGVETYFCYTMKLFFYTIKKFYKMKKFFYMMIFCTKLKIFFLNHKIIVFTRWKRFL